MKLIQKESKKGMGLGDMSTLAILLVVTAIVIAFGVTILANIQTTQTAGSSAFNATGDGITGLGTFSDNIPTIAIVIVGAIVIGILSTAFTITRS